MGRYALHQRGPGGVQLQAGEPVSRQHSGAPRKQGRVPGPNGLFVLASGLSGPGQMPVCDAIELVKAEWAQAVCRGELAAGTLETHCKVLATLAKFAKAQGCVLVSDLDAVVLHSWYRAPAARSKELPTLNTVSLRQSVARAFFRTMAFLGVTDRDVTVAVPALRRPERSVNPLNEKQVDALKRASGVRRTNHSGSAKGPAALALALLGLQSKGIPATRVKDIDFIAGTVSAHDGGARFVDRVVPIDDSWAWRTLAERVQYLQRLHAEKTNDIPVAYEPGARRGSTAPVNPAAATSNTLDEIFKNAGVKQPGRIRLASLNEYVALRVYEQTGSFVEVAARLGMRSLDAVAHIVDDGWLARRLNECATGR